MPSENGPSHLGRSGPATRAHDVMSKRVQALGHHGGQQRRRRAILAITSLSQPQVKPGPRAALCCCYAYVLTVPDAVVALHRLGLQQKKGREQHVQSASRAARRALCRAAPSATFKIYYVDILIYAPTATSGGCFRCHRQCPQGGQVFRPTPDIS